MPRFKSTTRSKWLFGAMLIIGVVSILYQNCGEINSTEDPNEGDSPNTQGFENMSMACKMDVDGNGAVEQADQEKLRHLMEQKMIPDPVKAKFDSNQDGSLDEKDLAYYQSNNGDSCKN